MTLQGLNRQPVFSEVLDHQNVLLIQALPRVQPSSDAQEIKSLATSDALTYPHLTKLPAGFKLYAVINSDQSGKYEAVTAVRPEGHCICLERRIKRALTPPPPSLAPDPESRTSGGLRVQSGCILSFLPPLSVLTQREERWVREANYIRQLKPHWRPGRRTRSTARGTGPGDGPRGGGRKPGARRAFPAQ